MKIVLKSVFRLLLLEQIIGNFNFLSVPFFVLTLKSLNKKLINRNIINYYV